MISRDSFLKVYVPMALKGASALDIANSLGVDKEDDQAKAMFVSQKAAIYRKELKAAAEAKAASEGLDAEATEKLVETYTNKLPKLRTRVRTQTATNMVSFLDDLLAECDAPE